MRIIPSRTLAAGMLAAGLTLGIPALALAAPQSTQGTKPPASVLLVLSAQKGTIAKTKNGYTLTLSGMDKNTLWFADRPDRRAGFANTNVVISNWSKLFKLSQPNAGLVHVGLRMRDRQHNSHPVSIELMNPKIQSNGDVVFAARALTGDLIETGHFSQPVLFIDNSAPPFCCQIVECSSC